jgi:hypothetical protein
LGVLLFPQPNNPPLSSVAHKVIKIKEIGLSRVMLEFKLLRLAVR